ncbi:hypothetical protein [Paenibacillus lautus]|uniref:hypothetical protein n=1 Tax=Paenibacillus lautus TaxID=1401 RepID=UPI0013E38EBE|nr:hypothetical protein [Paenibacillus lautus]
MKQTSDKRLYERHLAVRLRLEGHAFDETGGLLSRARQTISIYWQTYQTHGLLGMNMDHSPGQPAKLTEEQRSQLATMLEQQQPVTWVLKLGTPGHSRWWRSGSSRGLALP